MTNLRTSSTPPKTKIFVGRLPEDAKSSDLRLLFERFGEVTECDILNRYGFVHMKTDDMAARAIKELNNVEFMGVQISVEQSTGKKSGRGGGRGGPMRSRGGMRGRGSPYGRDFGRRPGMPPMRNGYYDNYERGYDNFYPSRGPPSGMMSRDRGMSLGDPERRPFDDMMRSPFERRPFSDMGRSPYDRPIPPGPAFDRRDDFGGPRMSSDMYRRRSPPPSSGFGGRGFEDDLDRYGPPSRRYPLDPQRRF